MIPVYTVPLSRDLSRYLKTIPNDFVVESRGSAVDIHFPDRVDDPDVRVVEKQLTTRFGAERIS